MHPAMREALGAIIGVDPEEVTYEVPAEYSEIVKAGREYEQLVSCPGWRRLLDDVELECNRHLSALRETTSTNASTIRALRDRWAMSEAVLKFIQVRPQQAIDGKNKASEEVRIELGDDATNELLGGDIDMGNDSMLEWASRQGLVKDPSIDDGGNGNSQERAYGVFDSLMDD